MSTIIILFNLIPIFLCVYFDKFLLVFLILFFIYLDNFVHFKLLSTINLKTMTFKIRNRIIINNVV